MRTLLIAAFVLTALALPANSQNAPAKPDPGVVRALAVNYELSSADGTRKCAITLDARAVGNSFAMNLNRQTCGPLFNFMGEVSGWQPGIAGAILFVGQNGRTIAEFTEGVGGIYEALREGDGVYFLANLQFIDPANRVQATDIFGDWNFSRPGGGPICRATLTNDPAGEELFAVKVQSKCDTAIERFGPVAWKLQRGDLVLLSSSGESLRFERQGEVWNKVPDKPRPLVMTRP